MTRGLAHSLPSYTNAITAANNAITARCNQRRIHACRARHAGRRHQERPHA